MNDIIFSNGFIFRTFTYNTYNYTDNRVGAASHYFAYMLSGRCKIATETETIEIHEGDFFYIPNKCSYQSHWYGTPEINFISLGFQCLPIFDNKTFPVQVIPYSEDAAVLFHELSEKNILCARDIGVFYTLAGILIPKMSHNPLCQSLEIIERTKKYLLQNPFAKTSDIAKNFAISEATLYSAFHKSSDVTLNQMRNNLLLEKAKDIIITTNQSIEHISESLKFSSVSYFRKKFKQYFDMTPMAMRKKYRL